LFLAEFGCFWCFRSSLAFDDLVLFEFVINPLSGFGHGDVKRGEFSLE
jgi:hypothetical protein